MLIIKASIILSYLMVFTTAIYCDYGIKNTGVTCSEGVCLYLDSRF